MKGYKEINSGQSDYTIGRDISGQLKEHLTSEIKFVKSPNTAYMYKAYALETGSKSPLLNNVEFLGSAKVKDLGVILNCRVSLGGPREIRVIQPRQGVDNWGIFFKY